MNTEIFMEIIGDQQYRWIDTAAGRGLASSDLDERLETRLEPDRAKGDESSKTIPAHRRSYSGRSWFTPRWTE